jgi:N-acetyl-anhydromuramyl-L-alanine amidase AmpD
MTRILKGRSIEKFGGCLYDGATEVEALDREELEALRGEEELSLQPGRFKVVASIRSKNYGPERMQGPYAIILHHTGGVFAGDLVTLTEPGKGAGGTSVSSNDLIDKNGTIYELCEFPKKAWHARAWNRRGWGIEISNRGQPDDKYPQAQIDAVVWRCRERRRVLGITDPKRLLRHKDVQSDKPDTSKNFPFDEVRRRVFASSDPVDDSTNEFALEKYSVGGLGKYHSLIALAFAGALRSEGASAMALHNARNVAFAAVRAADAPFRQGPRLVAIGKGAADAVTAAGEKLGTEPRSDLFGAVGEGANQEAVVRDALAKALRLIGQVAAVEALDASRATTRFRNTLLGLSDYFDGKV